MNTHAELTTISLRLLDLAARVEAIAQIDESGHKANGHSGRNGNGALHTCEYCGRRFRPNRSWQKYCGAGCRTATHARR